MRAAKTFKTFAIAAACLAGLASGGAFAQFAGGPTNHATTVKNLLENGRDDQLVVLEGYIVDQVRRKDYTFKDETGTITVEIKDRVFAGQRVDPKTKVRLEGEFEKEFAEPFFSEGVPPGKTGAPVPWIPQRAFSGTVFFQGEFFVL